MPTKTTTCEACDGSGQVDLMLSATDPANGPCEACGGKGAVSQTTKIMWVASTRPHAFYPHIMVPCWIMQEVTHAN